MKKITTNKACDHCFHLNDFQVPQCFLCRALISIPDLKKHFQRKFGKDWKVEWEQFKKLRRTDRALRISLNEPVGINYTEDDKINRRLYYENKRCW